MHVPQTLAGYLVACLIVLISGQAAARERGAYVPLDPTDELTRAYEERAIQDSSTIPRVSERDPNPEGGPRVWVAQFEVEDMVEYPQRGITQPDVVAFLEEVRQEYLAEDRVVAAGFTQRELEEVGSFLDRLGIHDEVPRLSYAPKDLIGTGEKIPESAIVKIIRQRNVNQSVIILDIVTAIYLRG